MMMKLVNLFLVLAVASAEAATLELRKLRMMKKNGGGKSGKSKGKGKGKSQDELITATLESHPFVFLSGRCFAPSTSGQAATCLSVGGVFVTGASDLDGDYEACCPSEFFDVPAIIAAATASGQFSADVNPQTGLTNCECIIPGSAISGAGIIFGGVYYCMAGSTMDLTGC